MNEEKIVTIPNILSVFRILLIPVFIYLFLSGKHDMALAIFLLASITDYLDGTIARKTGQITKVGRLLDPLADKVMLISVLACLAHEGWVPYWVLIVVVIKDAVLLLGGLLEWNRMRFARSSTRWGKASTVLFMFGVIMSFFTDYLAPWNLIVMYCALAISLVALGNYTYQFFMLRKDTKKNGK